MDPDAPLYVAQGTAITSLTSAFVYSVYGTIKHQPIGLLAGAAALNSGIAAATFFSVREYAVSPLLLTFVKSRQFVRRREQLEAAQARSKAGQEPSPPERLTWMQMRAEKLPDTAISGAFTGALYNYWWRGRAGVVRGTIAATAFCSVLQLGYNELRIWRVRYVHRQATQPVPDASLEPRRSIWERSLVLFGMRKMTDEEYLRKMVAQRNEALRRIAELEAQEAQEASRRTDEPTGES